MKQISIQVNNKVAQGDGTKIICNNTDYQINFTFDEEWEAHEIKTLRVKFGGKYEEVAFTGDTVELPQVDNTLYVEIGVYAGDLQTTTPAYFDCVKSILSGDAVHADPPEDIYNQLVNLVESGAIKGEKGEDYILTEADKQEIADNVDLTDYVKNTDYATSNMGGVVKISSGDSGICFISPTDQRLKIVSANESLIDAKKHIYRPITPSVLDYAIKVGITTNAETLTEEEKAAARSWLGIGAANEGGAPVKFEVVTVDVTGGGTALGLSYNGVGVTVAEFKEMIATSAVYFEWALNGETFTSSLFNMQDDVNGNTYLKITFFYSDASINLSQNPAI